MSVDLRRAISAYRTTCEKAAESYRAVKRDAKTQSARFKDSDKEFERMISGPRATAKNAMKDAAAQLQKCGYQYVADVEAQIRSYVEARPNPNCMEMLGAYRNFDLKASKTELSALLAQTGGNYTALRALQTIAERSGFKVDVGSVASLEKDLALLRNLVTDPIFMPVEVDEVRELCPKAPWRNNSGQIVGDAGRFETWHAMAGRSRIKKAEELATEIETKWINRTPLTVDSFVPITKPDGTTTSAEAQQIDAARPITEGIGITDVSAEADAIERAAQLGKRDAADAKRAADVLARYKV